ncbi:hypothetical protein MBLNU13_g11346t1 [Cladosporium sp. NU13]
MGVSTSHPSHAYDQLYLPADCFRLCNPNSCFCGGSHAHTHSHNCGHSNCGHHSRSKYVYVERNNLSGRESYRDPMELIERGLAPPGWGVNSMGLWRPKDYEVMRGLVAQWMAERRGLMEGEMMGGGLQGYGTGTAYPPQYHQVPPPWSQWQQGPWQGGQDGGMGKRDMIVDEETRDRTRLMHDILFGSDAEKQEKQVQEQLLKRLTPMIPELAKLLAMQQAQLNGASSNAGMMPGPLPAGGMPAGPMGMGGMSPYGPAGGMPGMTPMMYPSAGMGGMHPMMGGGDPSMMLGGGGDMGGGFSRRRNRGRRAMRDFDYDEDDDDDFGGFGGRGRGGMRRRRRGRYNFDDDDLFGDRGGEDSRFRGPPPRSPPRPRPNNGDGGGGGGSTSGGGGAVFDTFNDDARFRTVPAGDPQPAQWTSSRNTAPAPPPVATAQPPNRVLTPVEEPVNTSPPPMPINRPGPPQGAIPIPQERAPPYRFYETTHPPTYPGIPVDGFSPTRPIPIRHAHFRPEAGLARPRQDEENRGEPQAGGPAAPRDITPQ